MNSKQIVATGLLTIAAFGSLTFMPASADNTQVAAAATFDAAASLNAAETPQALVWDMTYGDQTPPADSDDAVVATENHDVSDLSMG